LARIEIDHHQNHLVAIWSRFAVAEQAVIVHFVKPQMQI
jgi:hypothetical protein